MKRVFSAVHSGPNDATQIQAVAWGIVYGFHLIALFSAWLVVIGGLIASAVSLVCWMLFSWPFELVIACIGYAIGAGIFYIVYKVGGTALLSSFYRSIVR
mgnify:CR=1 FL=1